MDRLVGQTASRRWFFCDVVHTLRKFNGVLIWKGSFNNTLTCSVAIVRIRSVIVYAEYFFLINDGRSEMDVRLSIAHINRMPVFFYEHIATGTLQRGGHFVASVRMCRHNRHIPTDALAVQPTNVRVHVVHNASAHSWPLCGVVHFQAIAAQLLHPNGAMMRFGRQHEIRNGNVFTIIISCPTLFKYHGCGAQLMNGMRLVGPGDDGLMRLLGGNGNVHCLAIRANRRTVRGDL